MYVDTAAHLVLMFHYGPADEYHISCNIFSLVRNTVQLGMHMKTGEIYLADGLYWWSRAGGVNKIKPDGSGYTSVIDSGIGSGGITGVAVDWMAGKPLL